jgi:hypothetical protein
MQSAEREDERWVAKLPCQTEAVHVDIPESESEAQPTSTEVSPRFWQVLQHFHAIARYRMRVDGRIA